MTLKGPSQLGPSLPALGTLRAFPRTRHTRFPLWNVLSRTLELYICMARCLTASSHIFAVS